MPPTADNDKDNVLHESQSFHSLTSNTPTTPRRKTLKLLTASPEVPIPPSLRQSPYLTSPIFSQALPSPTLPSEEDEKWLQDTIPIASQTRQLATEGGFPQFVNGGLQRRGSIIQLSKRAVQKNVITILTGGEAGQGVEYDVKSEDMGESCKLKLGDFRRARPSSLLLADPHNSAGALGVSHGPRSSTNNRRRRSASPYRPEPFNMDETFPYR